MSNWAEKRLDEILHNTLHPNDTFEFSCKMCGNCCRKRDEPIMLTGLDVYRIAKATNLAPMEAIMKFCGMYIGADSHLPIIHLRERDDGSCTLLRKGRCMVHTMKPVVCAIHPLGRYFSGEDHKIHYFKTNPCPQSQEAPQTWTLDEWLDAFGIKELDHMSDVWNHAIMEVANVTCKIDKEKIPTFAYSEILKALYIDYDIEKPYIEQLLVNMEGLSSILEKLKTL